MSLHRILIRAIILAAGFPCWIQAQGKFEVNFGISTPGYYSLTDWDLASNDNDRLDWYAPSYYYNGPEEKQLTYYDQQSYKSTLYPSVSVEMSYKLAESGFFKRLSLVGMIGYHMVGFENYNPVTRQSNKETAMRLDYLMGVRLRIIDTKHFCMYTQFLGGKDFRNDCEYWTIANEFLRDGHEEQVDWQVTFLGFRVGFGKGANWGIMTELGHGYEYSISQIFIFPGIRAGVSYKF